jgi:phage terminase large subunit-like protein
LRNSVLDKRQLLELLQEKERRVAGRKLWTYYPDEGPLRRELYAKHLAFFEAGLIHTERAAMAANRVGKTEGIGAYEVTLHLTGLYPDWWPGRRFPKPVNVLCGGDTSTTTRDILVFKLLGLKEDRGTCMVPRETLGKIAPAPGVPDHVDYAMVKHVTGGWSKLQFRSYDQGRVAWQGTERDVVWMDEEPPQDIYTEATLRTMTTRGMVICTFTPLNGLTDVALSFMPELAPSPT